MKSSAEVTLSGQDIISESQAPSSSSGSTITRPASRSLLALKVMGGWLLLVLLGWGLNLPVVSPLAKAFSVLSFGVLLPWLLIRIFRAVLFSVGRRLAFSYFLIGVVPIPMLLLLTAGTLYFLAGLFVGYQHRQALEELKAAVVFAAQEINLGPSPPQAVVPIRTRLRSFQPRKRSEDAKVASPAETKPPPAVRWAHYREGKRAAGWQQAPESWPSYLKPMNSDSSSVQAHLVLLDGLPKIVVATKQAANDMLVVLDADLEQQLIDMTGLWTRFLLAGEIGPSHVNISIGEETDFSLQPLKGKTDSDREEFFDDHDSELTPWARRGLIVWGELVPDAFDLSQPEGEEITLVASLMARPADVFWSLFSTTAEVDFYLLVLLGGAASLLASLYGIAVLLALVMIFQVGRAVNLLSTGTQAVVAGDFNVRLPAKRTDQLGALQGSFNEMTTNLKALVQEGARRQALEKELSIARDLQQSLLPQALPSTGPLVISAVFEPSAAIGGDYFDVIELDKDRLAIVVADVSGHGLSTGLRMASLKAALSVLIEEEHPPLEILERLSALVRSDRGQRYFVTATFAIVDTQTGELELWNAGHPPTYIVSEGVAREILLPGSPLGGLGMNFGTTTQQLQAGDFAVWLSDGFIETTDDRDEPFGFDRMLEVLQGEAEGPDELKKRVVDAVADFSAGQATDDDRTLVVMRYWPSTSSTDSPSRP